MIFLLSFTNSAVNHLVSLSKIPILRTPQFSTMSTNFFRSHAFAGNPIKLRTPKPTDPFSPISALKTLKTLLLGNTHEPHSPNFKILPFRKGRPLAGSVSSSAEPNWHLGWLSFGDCKAFLENSEVNLSEDSLVYLGSDSESDGVYVVYWAIDVTEAGNGLVKELGSKQFCFVELRTLMVATDWENDSAMGQLAIAGHARSLLEWHTVSCFCGFCGGKNILIDAGRRKQCSNELCKKKIYPRVDPPGESLEEAVRRETWEETGIEVGQVVYHSSQPWPVGPSSMPCQLMVGFFAYAKSLDINVDKAELEDAKWHSREDVKKALTFAEYEKAQKTAAGKVDQMCKGVERGQSLSSDFNVESGELAPMFIPGPFAIANHLISSWVNGVEGQLASSFSNL